MIIKMKTVLTLLRSAYDVVQLRSQPHSYLVAVLVQSRRMSLRGETGPFTECTPAPHLRDWTGSFAEHTYKCELHSGFPTVRSVRAKVSPGPDDNFRGKQTKDCLGLGQQSRGRKDCRALQSSSAHCARRYYNTNMITYKQTRPSAHYQASSIHNCSSSASVCMWTLASSGTQPQHSDASRIWSSYTP